MHPAHIRALVLRAHHAGFSPAQITRLTGVPARSQQRFVAEEVSGKMSHPFRERRGPGRPTELAPDLRERIQQWLADDAAIHGAEVLRRLRTEHHYRAGKNPVYAYLKQIRPPKPAPAPIVRFEGVAGEFAQHDFGTLSVTYTDDTTEKLTFYAGRLKYSRALSVGLVPDESTESFIRGMEAFAAALGGLPLINVIDNTKAAVIKRQKDPVTGAERIQYQEHFASFLAEANVFAEPTAPYSAQQKGSVENLIGFVKAGFLLARRFRDRADLVAQLADWLRWVNAERPCDATREIPAVRLQAEQPYLRPLPFGPAGYGLTSSAVVRRDGCIRRFGYAYYVPQEWIGQTITVKRHREEVVLHYAGETVRHPRIPENGKYSLLPEQRSALFVKPRGAVMAKRQILMDLSPEAEQFFTQLVHRRPQTWRGQDLPVVWALLEEWGPARLREAFACCVADGTIGSEYLRARLAGVAA